MHTFFGLMWPISRRVVEQRCLIVSVEVRNKKYAIEITTQQIEGEKWRERRNYCSNCCVQDFNAKWDRGCTASESCAGAGNKT